MSDAEVKINREFASLIPPLSSDERELLRDSLAVEGLRDSLVVWEEKHLLLDGHNRLGLCKELGIEPSSFTVPSPTGRRRTTSSSATSWPAATSPLKRPDTCTASVSRIEASGRDELIYTFDTGRRVHDCRPSLGAAESRL